MKLFLAVFFFLLFPLLLFSQKEPDRRLLVLKKGMENKTVTFGKWDEKGNDELELTYLGTIKNKDATYKLMTSLWIWGVSGRATSRILVYDNKNRFLGDYYLTMSCELPKKIKNNKLYFELKCEECAKKNTTEVSFYKGIPKHMVVNCNGATLLIGNFEPAD
ncbi:hypothetical protein FSS13T_05320 [Flavobacterium saliperosum S13]|nr:hypothetical protein FSS13T_05320 [Flavobacterium saliperosum S13]